MKIIAVYNIKGGVGKTATAVNLAYLSAQEGHATLLWDLDPQGAASFFYQVAPEIVGGTKKLLSGKTRLEDHIKPTTYPSLDLLPADFSYRNMDLLLDDFNKPTKRLRKLLAPLADRYDYIFLDCAPSISLVSENIFRAADVLLVPTIPTILSLRTLDQLGRHVEDNEITSLLIPFFSMADKRKQMHRLICERPPQKPRAFLTTAIPYLSEIERSGQAQAPVCVKKGPATQSYRELWLELQPYLLRLPPDSRQ